MPWKLNVISASDPVLQDAEGTTASLEIPTEFNGDRVATVEATYSDGTNAGPHNWTSYKEFDVAFKVRYAEGTIEMTKAFFDAVTDGSTVTLTVPLLERSDRRVHREPQRRHRHRYGLTAQHEQGGAFAPPLHCVIADPSRRRRRAEYTPVRPDRGPAAQGRSPDRCQTGWRVKRWLALPLGVYWEMRAPSALE